MLRAIVLSAAILPVLAGCAAPHADLVNAQGQKTRCSAMGLGVVGALVAVGMEHHCVEEAKKRGYREVPRGDKPAAAASTNQAKQQQ